jgi:hypothetical protein
MNDLTFAEDVLERKRLQRSMLPMALGVMNSPDGTLTNSVQPGRALPSALRTRLGNVQQQLDALDSQEVDTSALQAFAQQQGESGQTAMLNALAAQYAGENFQPVQAQFLKRAAAAAEPMKIGGGMLTPQGQFIKDPFAQRDQRRTALERQALGLERMAGEEERTTRDRDDRLAREKQAREDALARDALNAEFRRMGLDFQGQMLALRRDALGKKGDGQVGSFSPAGFTPQGQQVVTNTKSGVNYILSVQPDGTPNYTPYQGTMIPKGTFDKEVSAAGDLSAVASRADRLVQMVDANPDAFGLRSAAVSALPGAVQGYAAKAVGLTPQQLEARSTVLRQAAQEINELYGAALSMGEQARANTFLPNPSDPPEMLMSKLKAARDWAKTQVGRYSPGVTNAATQRSGGAAPAPGAGTLSPAEMEELARLRAKHGRQ